jgi:hypothetical protein
MMRGIISNKGGIYYARPKSQDQPAFDPALVVLVPCVRRNFYPVIRYTVTD